MKKILSAAAAIALLSTPVLAQTSSAPNAANELRQDQVRPGVLGPGVDGIAKDGSVIPGGDVEAKTGGDGNIGMRLDGSTNSGASGVDNNLSIGSSPKMSGDRPNSRVQPPPDTFNTK